ncbi:nitrate regulatory gene2 protein-like [Ipomoea triloba]|uniref:nitrate regulatory gene2 protein-like n=1 Tax=Ipomoea triloba TaxID=35885 RepID=UPI00125CF165|nr:nitrate regulatory gene2 protein-like [Ipomoea triloba]XP_031109020.1 nitrate regulatory gene2 protein-like [Ipomoea triloba]
MGGTSSKGERSEALRLCKERKRFIKEAIDSRYALAAAHVSYVQSLRNIGIGLGRYAEAEVLIEPSISIPPTDLDKTPSHLSYPSPSPPQIPGGASDSPVLNGSPVSPLTARLSYMKSGGTSAVTVKVATPVKNMYVEDGGFQMPPPPPPPMECGSSWDFFDPAGNSESFRFAVDNDGCMSFDDMEMNGEKDIDCGDMAQEEFMTPNSDTRSPRYSKLEVDNSHPVTPQGVKSNSHNGLGKSSAAANMLGKAGLQQSGSKGDKSLVGKDMYAEREDPSEFITHRAKDFLSSVKDIENQFFRASESGKEVSRMLEASKIRVGYSEAKGKLSASIYLTSIGGACCRRGTANTSEGEHGHGTKVITWKRTTSSRSSSSRNPLNAKDDNDDSGSDFVEDFCMIAGSHSSTLDRLYAWERKLYDEVKAIELIRREYDRKRVQLRHQFAKDLSSQVIDKTRAVVKDLHSRIRVALYAVDSISKRIEKMRDEELLPQLLELIQGLIRMWRAMLECHHTQYITISLAYHGKATLGRSSPRGEDQKQIVAQLLDEVECFGLSFADWINSQTSYVEALNGWLQNCILQPPERKSRRAFSPRRVVAPPIFALCRDWSAGIQSLPSRELNDAIRAFLYELRHSGEQRHEEQCNKEATATVDSSNNEEIVEKDGDKKHERCSNLSRMHASLTIVLDRLNKFSEASLKMCEDVRQKCDEAINAYVNYRPPQRSFSV